MPEENKIVLERIDAETVKKTETRIDVAIVNIPGLQKQKAELETQIATMQKQLVQIDEVLNEYAKLP